MNNLFSSSWQNCVYPRVWMYIIYTKKKNHVDNITSWLKTTIIFLTYKRATRFKRIFWQLFPLCFYSSLPDSESELLAELEDPELELESELLLVPLPLLLLLSLSLEGRGSLPTTSTTEWSERCESENETRRELWERVLGKNECV